MDYRMWLVLEGSEGEDLAVCADRIDGIHFDDHHNHTVITIGVNEFYVKPSVREIVDRITGGLRS